MASCRSRKTGNCSDCSQNKLLQEKPPETFPESFLISGSPALCVGRGGIACTYGNREAPAWPRRGKPFFGTVHVIAGSGWHKKGRPGTEWQRVPMEIQQKRACHPGVFPAMNRAVISDRWPGFRLCECHGLARRFPGPAGDAGARNGQFRREVIGVSSRSYFLVIV